MPGWLSCPSRPSPREVAAGSLVAVPLAVDELVRPLGIIYRRGKELSSTTQRFIELLQSEGQAVVAVDTDAADRMATSLRAGANGNSIGNPPAANHGDSNRTSGTGSR